MLKAEKQSLLRVDVSVMFTGRQGAGYHTYVINNSRVCKSVLSTVVVVVSSCVVEREDSLQLYFYGDNMAN